MLAIRLPPEIEKRLAKLAEMTGRTKTYYAVEAILEYIDDLEDFYLAEKRWENFRTRGKRGIPLSDLLEDYDLED